jgi:hypothetical protein
MNYSLIFGENMNKNNKRKEKKRRINFVQKIQQGKLKTYFSLFKS